MNAPSSSLPSLSPLLEELTRQQVPAGSLYVVATPIGNVCDIGLRALYILSLADAVACEDTRNTAQLLTRYGLSKPLIAAHEHNEQQAAARIVERLRQGDRIALVSDAGTPAISDPGVRIVDAVRAAGLNVVPLPGACAAVAALSAGGLPTDRFHFAGFLPSRASQRDAALSELAELPATLVLYEAPHRIAETVAAMRAAFGPSRRVVLARELTKLFEEMYRGPLSDASAWIQADSHRLKGEYVVLVEGAPSSGQDDSEADRILGILLEECSVKQAATLAARLTGGKKNALYERALALRKEKDQ